MPQADLSCSPCCGNPVCCDGELPAQVMISIVGKGGCACLTQTVGPFTLNPARTFPTPDYFEPHFAVPGLTFTNCGGFGLIDVLVAGCYYDEDEELLGFAADIQTLCTAVGTAPIQGGQHNNVYLAEVLSCSPFHAIIRDVPAGAANGPGCCDGTYDVEFTAV